MNFGEIFAEYFSQFRGQGVTIPTFSDREYKLAIYLGNNSIRKWDRVDGTLWNELYVRATDNTTDDWASISRTISSATVAYPCPTNMRKPPKEVWFYAGTNYDRSPVIDIGKLSGLSQLSNAVTFTGSANRGYTMHVTAAMASQLNGRGIDYLYYRKPLMLTIATTPAAIKPDMSDPNFMIQDMLTSRYTSAKNGFGIKVADREAKAALVNMKIENASGQEGKSDNIGLTPFEWGVNRPVNDITL